MSGLRIKKEGNSGFRNFANAPKMIRNDDGPVILLASRKVFGKFTAKVKQSNDCIV